MNVAGARYDVGMIETFEQAREAVRAEMAPLVGDPDRLFIFPFGREDENGWLVHWGVWSQASSGRMEFVSPLPKSATFVDRVTGFVSLTAADAESERIERMTLLTV